MTSPIRFSSDNNATACPEIVEAVIRANQGLAAAYGDDPCTGELDLAFGEFFGTEVRAFGVITGTAANALSLGTIAAPYGTIMAHRNSHVVCDECGAPEFYSGGARVVAVDGEHGKLTTATLGAALAANPASMRPAAVSLTQATDLGTVYRPAEIAALAALAHSRGMKVHMDGARFANALVALDCHPAEVTWKAGVDVLSFGATKNGAFGAEAVVFFDPSLAGDFALRRRRGGHLLSKSRYLSAQLIAYLDPAVWRKNAARANRLAQELARALPLAPLHPVEANEIFLALDPERRRRLRGLGFEFDDWAPAEARFVTSWDQPEDDIPALISALTELTGESAMPDLALPQPYLLFLGDVTEVVDAKTAFGLRDWAADRCVGEWSLPEAAVTTGLPRLEPGEAYHRGARALVIGVAPLGGRIGARWIPSLVEALEAGLDLISGMHTPLETVPELAEAARRTGRRLFDIRRPPPDIPVATGRRRSGLRLLTVGTDCALGKKYTALTLAREFRARGLSADFRATGQTGILIAGAGIPIDAVVSDFVAGAAELLTPDADPAHWDLVEGQGSLFHPSYAAVSLGLLHGTQPDVLVMCHELGRLTVCDFADYPLPPLEEAIDLNLRLARRTNPRVRCAGVSLNTASVAEADARAWLAAESRRLGLPVADPVRGGRELEQLVTSCLQRPA